MDVPRQGPIEEGGRVNQKRRTRAAIVDAAKAMLLDGVTPTVAQAAEAAGVSRTTAYRYFPTQDSLLLELAVNVDVDDIEALVQSPLGDDAPAERVRQVMAAFNRHVTEEEARYRAVMRLYLDLWLDAAAKGDEAPVVREGRRQRWIEHILTPLQGQVDGAELRRLVAALGVLMGPEAMSVLRDVARLDADEAQEVAAWAAATLLDAVLDADRPRR